MPMRFLNDDLVSLDAERRRLMAAYDGLPSAVRQAVRECDWDIHILRALPRFMDFGPLIEAIRRVKTAADAGAFIQAHAARARFNGAWRG